MIGSTTKWASFASVFQRGLTPLHWTTSPPGGVPGIRGKQPEVIAVAVAAQLLQTLA